MTPWWKGGRCFVAPVPRLDGSWEIVATDQEISMWGFDLWDGWWQ